MRNAPTKSDTRMLRHFKCGDFSSSACADLSTQKMAVNPVCINEILPVEVLELILHCACLDDPKTARSARNTCKLWRKVRAHRERHTRAYLFFKLLGNAEQRTHNLLRVKCSICGHLLSKYTQTGVKQMRVAQHTGQVLRQRKSLQFCDNCWKYTTDNGLPPN